MITREGADHQEPFREAAHGFATRCGRLAAWHGASLFRYAKKRQPALRRALDGASGQPQHVR
jgi:hypothetical protein